jgi:hypothetical protein
MDIREELKSGGAYPTGAVSAWPKKRHEELTKAMNKANPGNIAHSKKVKASPKEMITGLSKATGQAIRSGKVSAEIRNERYSTCKSCPSFIKDSKRCSECGCMMEMKTWIGGNPNTLCPLQKWSR